MKEEHMPDKNINLVAPESEQSSKEENLDYEIIPSTETTISNVSNNSDLLVQSNTDNINQNSNIRIFLRKDQNIRFKNSENDEWKSAKILGRSGKSTGKYKNHYNVETDENDTLSIDLENVTYEIIDNSSAEEILITSEESFTHEKIADAKEVELKNWQDFNVYTETQDKGQNTLTTRWVVTEKIGINDEPIIKARLVIRGFEEQEHNQSDSPTASKSTLRSFLLVSANEGWSPQTVDIKAAFLQGRPIERELYVQPPSEFAEADTIWKLNKVVYGLNDAARNWYLSVKEELLKHGLKQSLVDKALFRCYSDDGILQGLFLIHVDDFLIAGTNHFMKLTEKVTGKFQVGKKKEMDFKYIGLNIKCFEDCIKMDQNGYVNEISKVKLSEKRKKEKECPLNKRETREFRSIVGQLNWAAGQTRPDMVIEVVSLSMASKHPTVADMILANKAVDKLKNSEVNINYRKLGNFKDLSLRVYTDASWANLPDGTSSAGGYIIYVVGEDGKCAPIDWSSNKIQRTVHSTLAAESLAMVEGIDAAIYLGSMLTEIYMNNLQNKVPIITYIDNKSLLDNVQSTKQMKEKRLRVTIAEIREAIEKKHITEIKWVPTQMQLADSLTKRGASTYSLIQSFIDGRFSENNSAHSDIPTP